MTIIHHTGIAVKSIDHSISFYLHALGMNQVTKIVHDPLQKVKVVLLGYSDHPDLPPFLELVEPASEDSPIDRYLKSTNSVYHYCLEVENLEETIAITRNNKAIIVQKPVPAVLFNNRRIAWVLSPDKHLIEFLEMKS